MYISGDSSSLYNSIKLIQPRETEILNPLTFSYSTSPFSLYMHIHPVPSERKEKKKRITTTTIRVCQTVGLKLMCLSLCGGFHIEKIRWWRVFLLFYSRLPVAHSLPISPPLCTVLYSSYAIHFTSHLFTSEKYYLSLGAECTVSGVKNDNYVYDTPSDSSLTFRLLKL